MGNRAQSGWIERADAHPMLELERTVLGAGRHCIAGIDEAGRGPLAGPIVAAAVVLGEMVDGVNDSKLLTESRRESLFKILCDGPHAIGIEIVDAAFIDANGIQPANYAVMRGAAEHLPCTPDFLLVDGFAVPGCATPQMRVVKGDRRSLSIAAASIIAKVTRDRIMKRLHDVYPEYGFADHKGYGTKRHLKALEEYGPCPAHRRSFAPIAAAVATGPLFNESETTL